MPSGIAWVGGREEAVAVGGTATGSVGGENPDGGTRTGADRAAVAGVGGSETGGLVAGRAGNDESDAERVDSGETDAERVEAGRVDADEVAWQGRDAWRVVGRVAGDESACDRWSGGG